MASEKYQIGKIPWMLVVVVTIVMTALGTVWIILLQSNSMIFFNPGSVNCAEEFAALPYLVLLLSLVAYKLLGRKVSGVSLTYLYLAAVFTAAMAVNHYAIRVPPGFVSQRWLNPDTFSQFIPEFMAPPREVAEQILYGAPSIPWNYVTPMVIYWWLLYGFFGTFMASIGALWQREWIEIEQIPFPQTIAVYQVFEQTAQKRSKIPYIIGIVFGFAFQFVVFLIMTFPWFPDIYGWRCATLCYGAGCINSEHPLYSVVAFAMYSKNPSLAALFYMAPLTTLFTSTIFNIIFFIAVQAAYYAGYYTGLMSMPGCGRAECGPDALEYGGLFKFSTLANMGGGVGLVTMYLFLRREYLRDIFRSVVKPMTEEQKTTRVAFIVMVVSYIAIMGLLMMAGISFANAFLIPLMTWVLFFGALMVFGRTGYNAIGAGAHGLYWLRLTVYPELPETPDANYALTCVLMRQAGSDGLSQGWGGALAASFASYKFANLTKTDTRNMYYVMLVVAIVIPLVEWLVLFSMAYTYGAANLPFYQYSLFARDMFYAADPNNPWSGIAPEIMCGENWIAYWLSGIFIIWALSWLHARFMTFPLDPYGFLLSYANRSISEGIWDMVAVAWVLKLLTLRIGGSRAYEEYGVPVATGFLLGYALSILTGGLISAVRFFVPF